MTASTPQTPHHILVVDDEPDLEIMVRQRFRRQIRDKEFEFHFSHNGEEALSALSVKPHIDLVLSDINMPVMDGLTLLGKLNEMVHTRRAVIVSAYGDMPNIRTAMNRGAIDFLMKPIDFEDLEITIRKSLSHVLQLRESMSNRARLVAIHQELGVAARIQQSILPSEFPPFPQRPDFELHAHMLPAKEVGGDLFDFFLLDDDHLGIVLGDVSGKGVPASLFMAVSTALLRAYAKQRLEPGECLEQLNETLANRKTSWMFVTLFYGILNTRTGEFRYANGGHNPPYVFSSGSGVRQLPGDLNGMVVGVMAGMPYRTASIQIAPGDAILLYTDGVTEAVNQQNDFFNEEGLEAFLAQQDGVPIAKVVTDLHAAVDQFAKGMPQADDITVLGLRYLG
jgi:sigma-B regulation protein RsbU (phosphoserine phosphatase)